MKSLKFVMKIDVALKLKFKSPALFHNLDGNEHF